MLQKTLFGTAQTFDRFLQDGEHYTGEVRTKLIAIRNQMEALRKTLDLLRGEKQDSSTRLDDPALLFVFSVCPYTNRSKLIAMNASMGKR